MQTSVRYKIGQMLLMGFEGASVDAQSPIVQAIQADAIGGVILFDYNFQSQQFDKNIQNPAQVRQLNHDLQQFNTQARSQQQQPSLPLLISVDYEGGAVNRLKASYGFPPTLSAAQAGQMTAETVSKAATTMAETLQDLGFNLDFAPVVDVNVNPSNPIIGTLDRSFSADPQRVIDCAKRYTEAFKAHHILCAYKHFPGHGSSQTDSHLGFVDVSDSWQDCELAPYQALQNDDAWCPMIMTAHIVNRHLDPTGLPATLSHVILTGMLREALQYQGVIITDDMQMKAIADHYNLKNAITMAINAGADMLIIGNQLSDTPQNPRELIDHIEHEVITGAIALKTIEQAYARICQLKEKLVK